MGVVSVNRFDKRTVARIPGLELIWCGTDRHGWWRGRFKAHGVAFEIDERPTDSDLIEMVAECQRVSGQPMHILPEFDGFMGWRTRVEAPCGAWAMKFLVYRVMSNQVTDNTCQGCRVRLDELSAEGRATITATVHWVPDPNEIPF